MIIGGPHPTFVPDDALPHADFVARGEGGDGLMLELVEALAGERELESILGLSFWRDGRSFHNELRERCADLDVLPVPDLSLIVGAERIWETPIMTSLGCPFDCTFCTVTMMFGRKYRFRSPENVIAELEARRPKRVFFYDDNFAADKRRLKKLLGMMIDRGLTTKWMAQVRTDVARDEELLTLMQKSGCNRLALGFESVDQKTLDSYAKSQTVEDITDCIAALHRHGIKCHGMFVIGADSDTARTARDTVAFAEKHGIDSLMLNVLTPGLGTKQYEMMNAGARVFEERWQFYDGQHVIFAAAEHDAGRAADRGREGLPALLLAAPQSEVPCAPALRQAAGAPLGLALHPPLAARAGESRLPAGARRARQARRTGAGCASTRHCV